MKQPRRKNAGGISGHKMEVETALGTSTNGVSLNTEADTDFTTGQLGAGQEFQGEEGKCHRLH